MEQRSEILKSADELCRKAELHRRLMYGKDGKHRAGHRCAGQCGCTCNDTGEKLRQAICEAIDVLEDTKKSFKSKQLRELRKKLIDVLAEAQ